MCMCVCVCVCVWQASILVVCVLAGPVVVMVVRARRSGKGSSKKAVVPSWQPVESSDPALSSTGVCLEQEEMGMGMDDDDDEEHGLPLPPAMASPLAVGVATGYNVIR